MRRFSALLATAWQTLGQHPLQTLLSTLGLVIGVAALVAVLALADGLERHAREQVASTTDLQTITVASRTTETVDDVRIRRDSVMLLGPTDAQAFRARYSRLADAALTQQRSVDVAHDTIRTAAYLMATEASAWNFAPLDLRAGRVFAADETAPVVVLTRPLAARFGGETVVGQRLRVGETNAEVIGIVGDDDSPPMAVGLFETFSVETARYPPRLVIHARRAEEVAPLADSVRAWLGGRFTEGAGAFDVATDAFRTEQVRRGMLLFKLVMGLITGISVVVGGVGVMNVLLMAVTERTREIGVRKATGATRLDIVTQFLSEAVIVSCAGCALGVGVGIGAVFAAAPLIRHLTEVPFEPALTLGTLLVVAAVATAVGIVFGTYPAWRASRLDPVEAIRHE